MNPNQNTIYVLEFLKYSNLHGKANQWLLYHIVHTQIEKTFKKLATDLNALLSLS